MIDKSKYPKCPECNRTGGVKKWGNTKSGEQRYKCTSCKKTFLGSYKSKQSKSLTKEENYAIFIKWLLCNRHKATDKTERKTTRKEAAETIGISTYKLRKILKGDF